MNSAIQKIHANAIKATNKGHYSEAERLCGEILSHDKNFADAWFLMAMAAAGKMDVRRAIPNLVNALKLAPKNPEYLAQFSKLCALVNQDAKAMQAADRAMAQAPDSALTLDTIGVVYTKLGAYDKARGALNKAVAKEPNNHQYHFNLASVEQFLGKKKRAEKLYLETIKLKPSFARAHWALSELNKNEADVEQGELLHSLLENKTISDDDELYLCHALSRVKEKQGEYQAAFDLLQRGKFRYRAKLNYSWVVDERLFNAVKAAFPIKQSSSVETKQGEDAIFVLGMPRSGTTLTERILNSHSRVESLGELQNFGLAVKYQSGSDSRSILDEDVTRRTGELDFSAVGQRYLSSLASRSSDKLKFVDKMPLNFFQLGFIAESLPAAKIILLRRNPMDTCLSNFRQLFAVSFSYYNYHYDLVDTGHYFRMFEELMQFWMKLYADRIHVVDYEKLTANPEQEVVRMLDYCGLAWEPECLDFHQNTGAVATASAMQVREPIYTKSVQRWKKYEQQLEPIKAIFEEAGINY